MIKMDVDLREVSEYFFKNKTAVHITMNNGQWFNGEIVKVEEDRLILEERVLGQFPIFYTRIATIIPMRQRK